ncbi:MAG TPA: PAS domain S-box protein, partial [bacterium]|nr:PAS domain S-box protein [bacterium]
ELLTMGAAGQRTWRSVTKLPWLDAQGRLLGLVGVNRDITARKEAEQQLEAQRQLLQRVLDTIPDAVFLKDRESRYQLVNRAMADFFGHPPEWFIGKRPRDLAPQLAEPISSIEQADRDLVEGRRESVSHEGAAVTAKGQERWSLRTTVPVRDAEGRVTGLVGISRDITERKAAEQELVENRGLLQTIMDTVPEWLYLKDRAGRYHLVNRAMAEFLGRPPEWFIGKRPVDLVWRDPAETARMSAMDQAILEGGSACEAVEVPSISHDGQRQRWLLITKLPWRDAQGNVVGIVGINEDITERRNAEQAVRDSEARFRALIENATDIIIILKADGSIHYQSPSVSTVMGYEANGLLGTNILSYVHPDDAAHAAQELAEGVKTPGVVKQLELRVRHKDDSWHHVAVIGRNLLHDSAVRGVVINARDVTDRVQAEHALRVSEARFRALIENAMDVVSILEADGTIRYESPSVKALMGYEPSELVGVNAFTLIHPEDVAHAARELAEGVQSPGSARQVNLRFRHKDGSWHNLEVIGRNLLDDPSIHGIVVNSRDVTDRVRAEALSTRLGRIVENSTNEIYAFDVTTLKFVLVNGVARENLGYSMEELREMTPVDIKPEFTAESFEKFIAPLREGSRERITHQTIH